MQEKIILNSYFHRIVSTWNSLPEYIRRAASVNSFKGLVKKFFFYGLANFLVFLILLLLFTCYYFQYYLINRPLALRGHVTNASFKQ